MTLLRSCRKSGSELELRSTSLGSYVNLIAVLKVRTSLTFVCCNVRGQGLTTARGMAGAGLSLLGGRAQWLPGLSVTVRGSSPCELFTSTFPSSFLPYCWPQYEVLLETRSLPWESG